jgi:homopolymeric O-antigen transport system ATP-binding protein
MSDTVITVENLSKSYLVGHKSHGPGGRNDTFRDTIERETRNFLRNAVNLLRGRQVLLGDQVEEFWALKDVSFEVRRGEVLGIIGRNGAGKSTLLKILSRITEPTQGRITLRGRVASLLEVGTGFHSELTGRENIYLNGAILGMTRAEIRRKFDEIVAFAEVERFLDTPVKRYSSGMYVRLAFAVAAHLEPEILIIDEVLAVGDVEFQKRCLGKMQDVASMEGRTVLFVSHNMTAVQTLCDAALFIAEGRCVAQGPPDTIVHEYLRQPVRSEVIPLSRRIDRKGSGDVRFVRMTLEGRSGQEVSAFQCGSEATLRLEVESSAKHELRNINLSVGVDNETGQRVILLDSETIGTDIRLTSGWHSLGFKIPKMPLIPGRYRLTLWISVNGEPADWIKDACVIEVEAGDFYGTGRLLGPESGQGLFLVDHISLDSNINADLSLPMDTPVLSRKC